MDGWMDCGQAVCFCHQKIVDQAYICSICLSIFCAPSDVCATCKTPRALVDATVPNGPALAGIGMPGGAADASADQKPAKRRKHTANGVHNGGGTVDLTGGGNAGSTSNGTRGHSESKAG